jgi:hypothetical protein
VSIPMPGHAPGNAAHEQSMHEVFDWILFPLNPCTRCLILNPLPAQSMHEVFDWILFPLNPCTRYLILNPLPAQNSCWRFKDILITSLFKTNRSVCCVHCMFLWTCFNHILMQQATRILYVTTSKLLTAGYLDATSSALAMYYIVHVS